MNKSLIFSMYILASVQNSLYAMETIEPERKNITRFEDQLKEEERESKIKLYTKKIEIALEKIQAIQRKLTILKNAEQLHDNKMSFSNEESKIAVSKLTKIQLEKQKKELKLQKIKDKMQRLEQKKEELIEKQKQEKRNINERDKLRNEKIKNYEELLKKYDIQRSTINEEIEKCYILGEAPGNLIPEKKELEPNSIFDFVKEGYSSLEEKVLVFPANEWVRIINLYPKKFKWRSNQNTQPSITQKSEIVTNLIENVNFLGEVEIREKDIHHEGKLDSVVASLNNNEIKYTITMDETANLNFEKTMPYRLSKGLANAKNFTAPYEKVLNDKITGASIGGIFGGSLGFMASQFFKIDPAAGIKCGMAICAILSTLLAGGVRQKIEKEMEENNEKEALEIQGSKQGVEEYCKLKIVSEKCSYKTNNDSDFVGNKYFIVKEKEVARSKQNLVNDAKNYPEKNESLILKRRQFMEKPALVEIN